MSQLYLLVHPCKSIVITHQRRGESGTSRMPPLYFFIKIKPMLRFIIGNRLHTANNVGFTLTVSGKFCHLLLIFAKIGPD